MSQPTSLTAKDKLPAYKLHLLNALTVSDLKTELGKNGLAVSGKKAELIQRLMAGDATGPAAPVEAAAADDATAADSKPAAKKPAAKKKAKKVESESDEEYGSDAEDFDNSDSEEEVISVPTRGGSRRAAAVKINYAMFDESDEESAEETDSEANAAAAAETSFATGAAAAAEATPAPRVSAAAAEACDIEPHCDQPRSSCSACTDAANDGAQHLHPELSVPLCGRCYVRVGREFDVDDDGYELQCRWCGVGGELVGCDNCPGSWCVDCITRNLGKETLEAVQADEDWHCFSCDPRPVAALARATSATVDGVARRAGAKTKGQAGC